MSAKLLSLMVGNWMLQCFGGLQMYDVIYRDIRSAVSTGEADRQIMYKLYRLQINCTYSNYTEAAATCSAAQ